MKKIFFGILVGFLFVLSSCLDDSEGYSLDHYWVGFGIVNYENPEASDFRITMDNGDVLLPIATGAHHSGHYHLSDSHHHIDNGDRIMVNYTILGEEKNQDNEIEAYYVKINSAKKILTKHILDITPENADSIGNDPVLVKDVWMTDSLLNFKFKYWGSSEVHFINLVKEPGVITPDDQPVELEFRHNSNGDGEDVPFVAYVSFKMNEIQIEGQETVSFVVRATDYEGEEFVYEGEYSYGENN